MQDSPEVISFNPNPSVPSTKVMIEKTINLGNTPLNVYRVAAEGTYQLSPDSIAEAVGEQGHDLLQFMEDKPPFNDHLKLAAAYWLHCATRGNQKAVALILACMEESIECRADKFFGH